MMYAGKSLLDSPYRDAVRLLHVEAKAIELLCHLMVESRESGDSSIRNSSENDSWQLHLARRTLASKLDATQRIRDIARTVGMSESKFKRAFKAQFGVTVSDYRLECRMRHALGLLRGKRVSVGEAAYEVGYRHQTSFAAAFRLFFGFSPRDARNKMN
jgi:AraC-like DNA-binding protein